MGRRGPRGDLPEVQALKGNPNNRPKKPATVVATGAPFVADFLSDDAKACIAMITASMPPAVYKQVDGFLLAGFATQWELFKRLTVELKTEALTVPGSTGQAKSNDKIKSQQEALRLMATLGDRMGLTPHARASLSLPADTKPKSKFGDTLNAGGKKPN